MSDLAFDMKIERGLVKWVQLKPELILKIYQKIVLYSLLIRNFSKFTYVMKKHLKKLP